MEEDHESRFICRLCNKKCPSGKSLGGHMRSHVISNSAEASAKHNHNPTKLSFLMSNCKDSKPENGGQSGYGLRENPKKTWRVSDLNTHNHPLQQQQQQQQQQLQVCKQCGKGFQSLKALCGHMACHSEKDRFLKDDHSWTSENQKTEMIDSQSDTEDAEAPAPSQRPKRAASKRYKRIVVKSPSIVVDHEQEEVAVSLMMLSRDCANWAGVNNSVGDSSDNNSVVLETKSSSIDMRIGRKLDIGFTYGEGEGQKGKKLALLGAEIAQSECSDSGYFINGNTKMDSDVSVDGFWTNDNFKNQKHDGISRIDMSDSRLGKKAKHRGYCEPTFGLNSTNNDPRKRAFDASYDPDFCEEPYKNGSKKKQIVYCNGEKNKLKSKKSKGHECPICHKVYKSGQALGGHKRSHFLVSAEDRNKLNLVNNNIQEISDEGSDLLDLNLPPPADAETNEEDAQFMPW